MRIERGMQRGTLSRREAFGLRRDAQQIRFQLRGSQRDGIRGRELGQLRFPGRPARAAPAPSATTATAAASKGV